MCHGRWLAFVPIAQNCMCWFCLNLGAPHRSSPSWLELERTCASLSLRPVPAHTLPLSLAHTHAVATFQLSSGKNQPACAASTGGNPEAAAVNIHVPSAHKSAKCLAQLLMRGRGGALWLGHLPDRRQVDPLLRQRASEEPSDAHPGPSSERRGGHVTDLSADKKRMSQPAAVGPPRIMTKTISSPSNSLSLIISSEFN